MEVAGLLAVEEESATVEVASILEVGREVSVGVGGVIEVEVEEAVLSGGNCIVAVKIG